MGTIWDFDNDIPKVDGEKFWAEQEEYLKEYSRQFKKEHKRWRADYKGTFYYISINLFVHEKIDSYFLDDNNYYFRGNYFRYERDAKRVAMKLRKYKNRIKKIVGFI